MTVPPKDGTQIRTMFDQLAPRYDLMNRVMTFGQDQRWRRFAITKADIQAGHQVLDLAAGTGDIALEIKKQSPDSHVIAGDFSAGMLEVGKQRKGGDRIHWQVCDAMALPFEDASFDAVVFGYLLRNVESIDQVLREIYRVLKPGGRVVCLDTTPPKRGPLRPLIRAYLKFGLPILGKLLAGGGVSYAYLSNSTLSFASPAALSEYFIRQNFIDTQFKTFSCHTIAVHWAKKPV